MSKQITDPDEISRFLYEVGAITEKLVLATGLNVASDYEGVGNGSDVIIYLNAVLKEINQIQLTLQRIDQLIQLRKKVL